MSKLTLDPSFRAKLVGLYEPLEFCDETGQTIGHFLPGELYQQMIYSIAESKCPFPVEKLIKMRNETGGDSFELHEPAATRPRIGVPGKRLLHRPQSLKGASKGASTTNNAIIPWKKCPVDVVMGEIDR